MSGSSSVRMLQAYVPEDRVRALERGEDLPQRCLGAALFADISGFTPLTEHLTQTLGERRGIDELTRRINAVYDALVGEVQRRDGGIISFAGDAITCWFDGDNGERAVAAALSMQAAMRAFTDLALKVAVTRGPARRFVVGDAGIQLIDALGGATVARLAVGEHMAQRGEVLIDAEIARDQAALWHARDWRTAEDGEVFAVVGAIDQASLAASNRSPEAEQAAELEPSTLRPWLLPAVYERVSSGQSEFLTELRPALALFVRFSGIDYDDDEQAGARLDAFIRRAQAAAHRYDGALLQLNIGDKGSYIYFSFGAPTAHEDDARRAVHTALGIRAAALELGFLTPLQLGISHGILRSGAYGGAARRTYGVLGDEVNLAARLMTAAPAGEVLVADRVHDLAGEDFSYELRPPLTVKGKAEPVQAWLVTSVSRHRALRLQEPGYHLAMIGRQAELALIAGKLELVVQGSGQVIGLSGEAGIGKSRLVAEVIKLARQRGFSGYGGTCQSSGANTPYLPWTSIWQGFFDLDPDMPLEHQIRQLEEGLVQLAPARRPALPLLGALVELPIEPNDFILSLTPQDRKNALEALLEDCLRGRAQRQHPGTAQGQEPGMAQGQEPGMAQGQEPGTAQGQAPDGAQGGPILVVLEDLHWSDSLSRDLLERLSAAVAELPVCILLAYRPGDRLPAPGIQGLAHFTGIELRELDLDDSDALIRARLEQLVPQEAGAPPVALPASLVAHLAGRAQGNPYFLEELLNYLHDRGINPYDAEAVAAIELPTSLHSLVLSRIDQLGEAQKLTLKVASVIGRSFRFTWLHGCYPDLGAPEAVKEGLEELSRLSLTPQEPSEPELAYLFKHIVTQEVAYSSLGFATRARLHELLAQFIEARIEAQTDPSSFYLNLLAYHYERSDNLEKKRIYLRRAGEAAQAAFSSPAAIDYFQRLLPLIDTQSDQVDVLLRLGAALELVGNWDESEARYREALALAGQLEDRAATARSLKALGVLTRNRGDLGAALVWLDQAYATWEELGDRAGMCQLLCEKGGLLFYKAEYGRCRAILEEALSLARDLEDRAATAYALNWLGNATHFQDDYPAAREYHEASLAIRRELRDIPGIAASLNNLGNTAHLERNCDAARAYYQESLALRRQVGDLQAIAWSLNNLGNVVWSQEDTPAAQQLFDESLGYWRRLGSRWGIATVLSNLGSIATSLGAYSLAEARYGESLSLYREMGDRQSISALLYHQGLLALYQEHYHEARVKFLESLALARETGRTWLRIADLSALARLAAEEGVAGAEYATRLIAAADQLGIGPNAPSNAHDQLVYHKAITLAKATLGDERYQAVYTESHGLEEAALVASWPGSAPDDAPTAGSEDGPGSQDR